MTNLTATLPIRLLCQLILSSERTYQETNNIITVNQPSIESSQSVPVYLAKGYEPRFDIGFAYKYYTENVTWPDARKKCNEEGANLAVIDSRLKFESVIGLVIHTAHVGILRLYDNKQWSSVVTGLPLDSIPWTPGEPEGDYDCGIILTKHGINNYYCNGLRGYICEIPITNNDMGQTKILRISPN